MDKKLKGAAIINDDEMAFIHSEAMDRLLLMGTWTIWAIKAYRDWGKNKYGDAIIIATGISNLYATSKKFL